MMDYSQPSATGLPGVVTRQASADVYYFFERHFRLLTAILLLTMALAQFAVMRGESQANDESFHLLAGYSYLKTGIVPLVDEHPPLAQLIAALPLLPLRLRLPGPHPEAGDYQQYAREQEFLYANRYSAGTILMAARSADIAMTLLLGLVMAWWTRRHFGAVPALVALLLLVFDPNFLAHGHYTDTDVPVALCFLAGALNWNAFLSTGRLRDASVCGALTGVPCLPSIRQSCCSLPTFCFTWCTGGNCPGVRAPRVIVVRSGILLRACWHWWHACFWWYSLSSTLRHAR